MNETVFTVIKIFGVLFVICKFINMAAHLSDAGETRSVMGKSLSLRAGIFSTR